jgi:hypothetical protein
MQQKKYEAAFGNGKIGKRRIDLMENIFESHKLQIEEKQRIDEYIGLIEDTVHKVQKRKLRGKSCLAYVSEVYRMNQKGICQDMSERKFLSVVLGAKKK